MKEEIYPITAIQKKPSMVKEAANKGIVHITEQGSKAFVFCSEDVFEDYIKTSNEEAVSQAMFDEALTDLVFTGMRQYESGQGMSVEEAKEKSQQMRASKKEETLSVEGKLEAILILYGRKLGISYAAIKDAKTREILINDLIENPEKLNETITNG